MYDQTPEIKPATATVPWNKGKLIGQKPPHTLKQIWAIRIRLQINRRVRDLTLFNLAIDSKLRGCDLVRLRMRDVVHGDQVVPRATVMQRKTGQPMRFEVTEQTRDAVQTWIAERELSAADFLFTSRIRASRHLSTRQYARNVRGWIALIGLDSGAYGTHSLRRTKATLIYRRTMNRRAVQLLLRHANIQSTVAYLGSEVDDALEIAEHTEIQHHRIVFRNLTDHQRAKGTRFRAPFALSPPPKNTGP